MKSILFIGSSQDDLCDFPIEARRECGRELNRVQYGLMPTDFKPMLNVGSSSLSDLKGIGCKSAWPVHI